MKQIFFSLGWGRSPGTAPSFGDLDIFYESFSMHIFSAIVTIKNVMDINLGFGLELASFSLSM